MTEVLHICYPGVGGQAAVATGLAVEGMRSDSQQAIVFYGVEPTAGQYTDLCEAEGIAYQSIVKRPGIGIGARRRLHAAIDLYDPDVIIAHHHDTAITAALHRSGSRGTKVVFVEHHSNALKSRKDWVMSTLAHRLSDHTVYLTESYRSTVQNKTRWFYRPEKTSVIANGLDMCDYIRREGESENSIVVGMQGRMDAGKDFAVLQQAFALLKKIRPNDDLALELIGDGPDRSHLENNAPEGATFTGFLSHGELLKRMRGWDIAVLATEGETLSMAILEAWALGIPMVASDVSGVGDLIQDKLVNPGERRSLLDASSTTFSGGLQFMAGTHSRKSNNYSQGFIKTKLSF